MSNRRAAQITGALLALMAVSSLALLFRLPAGTHIAVHFAPEGHPDGWAPAAKGLFFLPAVTAAIWLLMFALPQIDPRGKNLLRSSSAYGTIWIAITLLFCVAHGLRVSAALGAQPDGARILVATAGAVYVLAGNMLGKLRWNYTIGLRTPWALADERVWDKTHRFGGWLFVIGGSIVIASAFMPLTGGTRARLLFWGTVAIIVLIFIKSYLLWREQRPEQCDEE